jgi:endo-1,4-beta-D-glucanase Y
VGRAQAYALLRAGWAGDEATFGMVYTWTQKNLSRPDHLLSWRWGRRADGPWGVMDTHTASDGDVDYALALRLAGLRGWKPPPGLPDYPTEAQEVQAAILEKEVVALPGGTLVLTPGDWHEAAPPYLLNPSYFSPAAYQSTLCVGGPPASKPDVGLGYLPGHGDFRLNNPGILRSPARNTLQHNFVQGNLPPQPPKMS